MERKKKIVNINVIFFGTLLIISFIIQNFIIKTQAVQPSNGYFIAEINESFENISDFTDTTPFYTTYKIEAGKATDGIKAGIESENMVFKTTMYQSDILQDMPSAEHKVSLYYNKNNCPFKEKGVYRYIIKPIMENPEFHFDEEEYTLDVYVGIIKKEYITQVVKDKDGNVLKNEDGSDKTEKIEKNTLGIRAVLIYNKNGEKVTNIKGSYHKTPETKTMSITFDANNFTYLPSTTDKPKEVIVSVYQYKDNISEKYMDVILNSENNWVGTISVPRSIGEETYQYYVEQNELELFTTSYNRGNSVNNLISKADRIIITNKYIGFDLTFNTNWKTQDDEIEKPIINLDIYNTINDTITKTITLSTTNNEKQIIALPNTIDGKSASYYIKLNKDIEDYNITIDKANSPTNAIGSATIINVICEKQGITQLPIILYWYASDVVNEENVVISLYADNKQIQTKAINFDDNKDIPECEILFENLQIYNNGQAIQYKLKIEGNEKGHIIGCTKQEILKEYILSTEINEIPIKIYFGEKAIPEMGVSTNVQYSLISITIIIFVMIVYIYLNKKKK